MSENVFYYLKFFGFGAKILGSKVIFPSNLLISYVALENSVSV